MRFHQRDVLSKSFRLLRWILDDSNTEWGVRQLAEALRLSPSTVYRLLIALEEHGLLEKDHQSGRYRIGFELYRMAYRAQSKFPLREIAMPLMRRMVDECNETVFLGVYDRFRMEMMYIAVAESQHPLRYVLPLYEWIPVYCGASGLVIMAFLPEEERRLIIERTKLTPLTDRTITDPAILEQELAIIRDKGYSITRGQRIPGAIAIAAPIWGPDGRVLGEIHITTPEQRFEASKEPELIALVMRYAKLITDRISGQPMARSDGAA